MPRIFCQVLQRTNIREPVLITPRNLQISLRVLSHYLHLARRVSFNEVTQCTPGEESLFRSGKAGCSRPPRPFEYNYRATRTMVKFNRHIRCSRRCAMNNQIIIIDPIFEGCDFASYANIASTD